MLHLAQRTRLENKCLTSFLVLHEKFPRTTSDQVRKKVTVFFSSQLYSSSYCLEKLKRSLDSKSIYFSVDIGTLYQNIF